MIKTTTDDWLFFAESDLKLAKKALEEGIYHLACFHAQQTAEKLLKTCLAAADKPAPRIHSLVDLYERVQPSYPELEQYRNALEILDQYYIPTRYPDALPGTLPEGLPTEQHAQEAIVAVDGLFELIKKFLGQLAEDVIDRQIVVERLRSAKKTDLLPIASEQ